MAFINLPEEATSAGARVSSHLAIALRSNRLFHENALQVFNQRLAANLRGHLHRDPGDEGDYDNRFNIETGTNDSVNFVFKGRNVPKQTVVAILESGTYSAISLAAALQEQMRMATIPENQQIVVTFTQVENNPFRGKFTIQHTGVEAGDTLDLLFASGANATDTLAPVMGFAANNGNVSDRKGALSYTAQQFTVTG